MLERNEKGFTLIEIIVSTAIASIVIAVTLSMILTSFDLFGNLSTTKLKKDSLDNIESYVRSQILNAGTVVISSKKPAGDDWKWLYVDHDMLYRGDKNNEDGKPVLAVDYYNKKSLDDSSSKANVLAIGVKVYHMSTDQDSESGFRAKFSYVFSNSDEKYTKGDTVKFSNVKSLSDNQTSPYDGDIRNIKAGKDTSYVLSSTMKLYYKGSSSSSSSDSDNQKGSYTGTVVDKLQLMSSYLNRGYFVKKSESDQNADYFDLPTNNSYRLGDFVYYQGYWWLKISNDETTVYDPIADNNGKASWQKMDKNYTNASVYLKGDIVLYNGYYYQCNIPSTSYNAPEKSHTNNWEDNGIEVSDARWNCLGKENEIDTSVPGYDPSLVNFGDGNMSNIFKLQAPSTSPINDSARTSLPNYKTYSTKYDGVPVYNENTFDTKNFSVGSLIQVKVANSGKNGGDTDCYYRLYKKIYKPDATTNKSDLVPGGSFMSGWKLLENEYMPNSSYEAGDSVRIATTSLNVDGNEKNYIQFLSEGVISEKLKVNYKVQVESDNWNYKFNTEIASYNVKVSSLGTKSSYEYLAYKFELMDQYKMKIDKDKNVIPNDYYYTMYNNETTKDYIKKAMIFTLNKKNSQKYSIWSEEIRGNKEFTIDNDAMMNTYWTRKSVNELNNG